MSDRGSPGWWSILFLYTYGAERFYRALDWSLRERFTDKDSEQCALMVRDLEEVAPSHDDAA
jgi:hypothetical protein